MQAASLAATQFGSQNSQIYLGMKFVIVVLSRVQLFATPRTEARRGPLSRGLSRREYWSGLHALSRIPSRLRDRTHVS